MMKNSNNFNVKIIAEIGVNHNGKLILAKKLIDSAKSCGADFVKFQMYDPDEMITTYANKTDYQKKNDGKEGNQYKMLKDYHFSFEKFKILKKYCKKKKIKFLASAFDLKSLNNLKRLRLNHYKIPSGEITNIPYLEELAKLKKNVFLSTGMSDLNEIRAALKVLIKNGLKKKQIVLMQCTSNYPTKISNLNLNVLKIFKKEFNISLGFSDHSLEIETPLYAIFNGATIIEKHLTLDKKMKGPDHRASLDIFEFKKMVENIKNFKKSLGKFKKKPNLEEKKIALLVRKSIVARKTIKKGEIFNHMNLTCKRPGYGISPSKMKSIINKKSNKNYKLNEMIKIQ